jgi:hypothetical protein
VVQQPHAIIKKRELPFKMGFQFVFGHSKVGYMPSRSLPIAFFRRFYVLRAVTICDYNELDWMRAKITTSKPSSSSLEERGQRKKKR